MHAYVFYETLNHDSLLTSVLVSALVIVILCELIETDAGSALTSAVSNRSLNCLARLIDIIPFSARTWSGVRSPTDCSLRGARPASHAASASVLRSDLRSVRRTARFAAWNPFPSTGTDGKLIACPEAEVCPLSSSPPDESAAICLVQTIGRTQWLVVGYIGRWSWWLRSTFPRLLLPSKPVHNHHAVGSVSHRKSDLWTNTDTIDLRPI